MCCLPTLALRLDLDLDLAPAQHALAEGTAALKAGPATADLLAEMGHLRFRARLVRDTLAYAAAHPAVGPGPAPEAVVTAHEHRFYLRVGCFLFC